MRSGLRCRPGPSGPLFGENSTLCCFPGPHNPFFIAQDDRPGGVIEESCCCLLLFCCLGAVGVQLGCSFPRKTAPSNRLCNQHFSLSGCKGCSFFRLLLCFYKSAVLRLERAMKQGTLFFPHSICCLTVIDIINMECYHSEEIQLN